jgi:hypothetical protein
MPVCILSTYEPVGCFSQNSYQHSAAGGYLAILYNLQVINDVCGRHLGL